jgi:hypothetical protein
MVQKELRKHSQWFWEGFLKWYDGGGENGITSKRRFWGCSIFLHLEYWLPLYLKRLLELFFFFLYFFFFSLFFYTPSLVGFDDIWGEKSLLQKFLFKWNGMVRTLDILAVDGYSEMELYVPI